MQIISNFLLRGSHIGLCVRLKKIILYLWCANMLLSPVWKNCMTYTDLTSSAEDIRDPRKWAAQPWCGRTISPRLHLRFQSASSNNSVRKSSDSWPERMMFFGIIANSRCKVKPQSSFVALDVFQSCLVSFLFGMKAIKILWTCAFPVSRQCRLAVCQLCLLQLHRFVRVIGSVHWFLLGLSQPAKAYNRTEDCGDTRSLVVVYRFMEARTNLLIHDIWCVSLLSLFHS